MSMIKTTANAALILGATVLFSISVYAQATEFVDIEENPAAAGYSKTFEQSERFRNGEWEATNREYWYYSDGDLEMKRFDSMFGDDWRTSRRELYTRGRSPSTMTIKMEDRRVNVYAATQVHQYTYDEEGRITSLEMSAFGPNGQEIPVWLNRFTRAEDGQQTVESHVQSRWTGDTWRDEKRVEHIYDADGLETSGLQRHMRNGAWEDDQRKTLTYRDGCLERRTVDLYRDGTWITAFEERHECDAAGWPMEAHHYTALNESRQMEPMLRKRFQYDEAGNRVVTTFQRLVDNVWTSQRRLRSEFHRAGEEPGAPPSVRGGGGR